MFLQYSLSIVIFSHMVLIRAHPFPIEYTWDLAWVTGVISKMQVLSSVLRQRSLFWVIGFSQINPNCCLGVHASVLLVCRFWVLVLNLAHTLWPISLTTTCRCIVPRDNTGNMSNILACSIVITKAVISLWNGLYVKFSSFHHAWYVFLNFVVVWFLAIIIRTSCGKSPVSPSLIIAAATDCKQSCDWIQLKARDTFPHKFPRKLVMWSRSWEVCSANTVVRSLANCCVSAMVRRDDLSGFSRFPNSEVTVLNWFT